ncbi:MAG: hypothetical protein KDJ38_01450 [Gammaproteobacteria bacterium]|nr:hypothetical protein [Gammaproteobacteria bacterium]
MQTPQNPDQILHELHNVMQTLLQNVQDEQWQQVEIKDQDRMVLVSQLSTIQAPLSEEGKQLVKAISDIDRQVMALTMEARRVAAEAVRGFTSQKSGCLQYMQNQNIR